MSNQDQEPREGLSMSFLEHLDELRSRLIYSVAAVGIAFGLCFAFSEQIFDFLAVPGKKELARVRREKQALYGRPDLERVKDGEIVQHSFVQETVVDRVPVPMGTTIRCKVVTVDHRKSLVLAEAWSVGKTTLPAETPLNQIVKDGEGQALYGDQDLLVLTSIPGGFTLYMRVALYLGIGLAIPFILFQLWAFISPGLYRHEKRSAVPVLTMTGVLFIAGAAFAYYVAFPGACNYLLGLQAAGGFRILPDAESYFDLIILMMIGLGLVFQIPTVAFLLGRLGLITPRMMWKAWRQAVVVIAILSAFLTPTTDAASMTIFAAPMLALYFVSIGIVWLFGKPRRTDQEVIALAATAAFPIKAWIQDQSARYRPRS
ncbi:MAG TPA: twin-arginine translocase subunit TatC [Blastocatellia bacterium]|nr:twin-arginine translocase subunit TatC [Blastocatellia bacterium]